MMPRLAVATTQPSFQWVTEAVSQALKQLGFENEHSPLSGLTSHPQISSGHVAYLGADKFIFTFNPKNTNSIYSENMALKQTKLIIYYQHTKIIYTVSILLQPIFLKIT